MEEMNVIRLLELIHVLQFEVFFFFFFFLCANSPFLWLQLGGNEYTDKCIQLASFLTCTLPPYLSVCSSFVKLEWYALDNMGRVRWLKRNMGGKKLCCNRRKMGIEIKDSMLALPGDNAKPIHKNLKTTIYLHYWPYMHRIVAVVNSAILCAIMTFMAIVFAYVLPSHLGCTNQEDVSSTSSRSWFVWMASGLKGMK